MFKKIAALATAAVLCAGLMAGCGASSTTADTSYSAENPLVLTLAHGLSETHTVHIAMTQFAEEVNEKTDGRVQVKIFPNGQLGSENENLEQLQAGVIAMTKVSAPGLATYNEAYNAFGLPYIFNDTEDFYHVMDSQQMQDFFLSTACGAARWRTVCVGCTWARMITLPSRSSPPSLWHGWKRCCAAVVKPRVLLLLLMWCWTRLPAG